MDDCVNIEGDSSLSRILWSIQNTLDLHESYGDRVDVENRQESLLEMADQLDTVNFHGIGGSVDDVAGNGVVSPA